MAVSATSGGEEARQDLEREVTCSLCLDILQDPKLLSCDHVFCKSPCIESLARRSTNNAISCPECRAITKIPGNVSNLRTAFFVNRLKDILGKISRPLLTPEPNTKPAPTPTSVELKPPAGYCDTHISQKLDLYCRQCKQLICRDCIAIQHKHHLHDYDVVSKVVPDYKRSVIDHLSSIEQIRRDVEKALEVATQARKLITSEKVGVAKDISRMFGSGEVSNVRVRSCQSLTSRTIDVQLERIRCYEERIQLVWSELDDLVISVHRNVFEKCDVEFLSTMTELVSHIQKLSSQYIGISKLPLKFPYAASFISEKYCVFNGE